MKKFLTLAGLASALLLSACSTIATPINQTQVYQLENAYGVVQSAAVAYVALPRCLAGSHASLGNVCSEHSVIVTLAKDDQKARIALNALEAFTRNPSNYPGLTFSGLIAAAQSAISVLQQFESTNSIGA